MNIMGTEWSVSYRTKEEDKMLEDADGYCDCTTHEIVLKGKDESCDLHDFAEHQKRVFRHEIIHAYLFESGIGTEYHVEGYGHDEVMIDWFARQFQKIQKTFVECGCI